MVKQLMSKGWKKMFEQRIPLLLIYAQQNGWREISVRPAAFADRLPHFGKAPSMKKKMSRC